MTGVDRVRTLIQNTFGECPEGLAERVISLVTESANVARESELETDMLPGGMDKELAWLTGKFFSRENDVRHTEANLGQEGQVNGRDGNGRGDNTDGDDGGNS